MILKNHTNTKPCFTLGCMVIFVVKYFLCTNMLFITPFFNLLQMLDCKFLSCKALQTTLATKNTPHSPSKATNSPYIRQKPLVIMTISRHNNTFNFVPIIH